MVDLAYDWSLMGWGMRAIVIALVVALALVVASPHVGFLKPIAEKLGLVTTQTIYVPVNHTVYVNRTIYVNQTVIKYINQTVPVYVYVNKTVYVPISSYFESYAGYCSGRLVFLSNDTAWIVWFWLAPKAYLDSNPAIYRYYFNNATLMYYNSTTHYAQFTPTLADAEFLSLQGQMLVMTVPFCYVDNVTINNYYVLACGDTLGSGPVSFLGNAFARNATDVWEVLNVSGIPPVVGSPILPIRNTTYMGVMIIPYYINGQKITTLGPICDLTVTFMSNATAALWLPVTNNQTLINYWRESVIPVYGWYNQYDDLMGYWVWNYPLR
ncbi:MAG: hypothetical protein L7H05_03345 [Vulcanisaeta sp.]|nr:hypothetical protein [Vulcanisaeta sp.]